MTPRLIPFFWLAGVVHLLIASANFVAWRMFDYRGELAKVSRTVRQVFVVQNVFIVVVLCAIAGLCFVHAADLAGATTLGRRVSTFLAAFWALRLVIHLAYYDRVKRGQHPVFDLLFVAAFVYLIAVFMLGAIA
jgi:hypothetical protein